MTSRRIWILLPAFNEEQSLPKLLPRIQEAFTSRSLDYRIVAVDDGSTDATATLLDAARDHYPLDVITHRTNRGLGETERDGFEFLAEHAAPLDVIIRFDCDNTHSPEELFRLLAKLDEGYDVVCASRFQPGGGQLGVNAYRSFISLGANLFMRLLFNIPGVKDYSCGFRAYRAAAIHDAVRIFGNGFIQLKGLGFTSTLETIVKLKLLGCTFAEAPFLLRYDLKESSSKMVSSVTTLGYLTMALLYHWPMGGWRPFFKGLDKTWRESPELAFQKYSRQNVKRSGICQIGG